MAVLVAVGTTCSISADTLMTSSGDDLHWEGPIIPEEGLWEYSVSAVFSADLQDAEVTFLSSHPVAGSGQFEMQMSPMNTDTMITFSDGGIEAYLELHGDFSEGLTELNFGEVVESTTIAWYHPDYNEENFVSALTGANVAQSALVPEPTSWLVAITGALLGFVYARNRLLA
jgi:hypothetical protein